MGCSSSKIAETTDTVVSAINVFEAKGDPKGRCNVMVKECSDYLTKLKRAEKELKALSTAAEAALEGSKTVLESPLPHIFEDTAAAAGGAAKPVESIGGAQFSGEAVARAKAELVQRAQAEVFTPMQQWVTSFNDAVAKNKVVNKAYDEVKSLQKKVDGLKAKVDGLRAKASQGDPKAQKSLEDATKQLQVQEGQLTIATSRHDQEEAEQYAKLVALISSAVNLRAYVKNALAAVSAALAGATEAMLTPLPEPTPAPTAGLVQQQSLGAGTPTAAAAAAAPVASAVAPQPVPDAGLPVPQPEPEPQAQAQPEGVAEPPAPAPAPQPQPDAPTPVAGTDGGAENGAAPSAPSAPMYPQVQ